VPARCAEDASLGRSAVAGFLSHGLMNEPRPFRAATTAQMHFTASHGD
jgi:hypothetical protein